MTSAMTKYWMIGVFFVGLFTVAMPERAEACGTLDDQIEWYWKAGSEKPQALWQITGMCAEFSAYHSEEPLLAVFLDAIEADIPESQVRANFEAFWCLAGMAGSDDHDAILRGIPDALCPTSEEVADWYVVAVDAANIRRAADPDAERIGVARRNKLVWKVGKTGEWFEVRRLGENIEGFIHASLLAPYRPRRSR